MQCTVGFANETSEQLTLSKILLSSTVEKTEEEEIHEGEKATSQKDSDATAVLPTTLHPREINSRRKKRTCSLRGSVQIIVSNTIKCHGKSITFPLLYTHQIWVISKVMSVTFCNPQPKS